MLFTKRNPPQQIPKQSRNDGWNPGLSDYNIKLSFIDKYILTYAVSRGMIQKDDNTLREVFMKEILEAKLLKYALYAAGALGIALLISLPFLLDFYFNFFYDVYSVQDGYRAFVMLFLYVVGVLLLWILAEMILLLRSIPKGPFNARNVRALKRMGCIGAVISLIFFIKCFFYVTILTLFVGIIMVVCSLFAFTLASLISQAVVYKEDSELTI